MFNEIKEINKDKDISSKSDKNNNLKILNDYIGPLIFIHNIIEEIINKVILMEHKKNIINNFLVSSTSSMEIKNKKKYNNQISKENNIDIKCIKTKIQHK